jgi:pentatricopeptide repeat protein
LVHYLGAGDTEAASNYFDMAVKEGVIVKNRGFFHGLIHECAKAQAAEACVWITAQMVRLGIPPTIITFNALIDACAKARNVRLATNMWDLMLELNLKPTCITYNTMLNACAQVHDGAQAEIWMRRMLNAGITPCIVSYSSVISAFAKVGDIEKAEEWFWRLQNSGVVADRKIFNSMINACAKAENPDKAQFWFEVMEKAGIRPDEKTYNSLIHASAKVGSIQSATRWLTEMELEGFRPDQVTLSSVIHACAKGGNAEEAEEWMYKMTSMGVAPNDVCYNVVLHACASNGDHKGAYRWIQQMSQLGIPPNQITYNCMIDACAKIGAMNQCQMWLENMIKGGFHPDQRTYTTLSNAGSSGTERERLWAFESIILAYTKEGNMDRVQQWLSKMLSDGLVPSDTVRNRLQHFCNTSEASATSDIRKKISMANDVNGARHVPPQSSFQNNQNRNKGREAGKNRRNDIDAMDFKPRNQNYKGGGQRHQAPNTYRTPGIQPDVAERNDGLHPYQFSGPALAAALASHPDLLQIASQASMARNRGEVQDLQQLSQQALATLAMNPALLQLASQYASAGSSPVANSYVGIPEQKSLRKPLRNMSDIGIGASVPQAWDTFDSIPYPPQMVGMVERGLASRR